MNIFHLKNQSKTFLIMWLKGHRLSTINIFKTKKYAVFKSSIRKANK